MNIYLALSFLFFIGATIGWLIEFFFRNLITHSGPKNRYYINPGFCKGPYLPIYGIGLVTMFLISYSIDARCSDVQTIIIILFIGFSMTFIEFIGGIWLLKVMNIRLWDYRDNLGNIEGVICPLFSLIWALLGAIYYLFIHPYIIDALIWLSNNLAFSFFVGLFFGFFIIDLYLSTKDVIDIRKFARENKAIIKLENYKKYLNSLRLQTKQKFTFFNQLKSNHPSIYDYLVDFEQFAENEVERLKKLNKNNK